MRPRLLTLLLLLIAWSSACSSRFQRSKFDDPFASGRGSRSDQSAIANGYPQLIPAGPAPDVTQAGRETTRSVFPFESPQRRANETENRESEPLSRVPSAGDENLQDSSMPHGFAGGETPRERAPDCSWIQGRLEYSALGGGTWKIRYAPLSADDEHGGSVILESPPDLDRFRSGDAVYVEGRIVSRQARGPLPNPVYRVELMRKARQ